MLTGENNAAVYQIGYAERYGMADGLSDLLDAIPILRNERTSLLLSVHREMILELRQQGKTYQMIADALTQYGISVSAQTIRRYTKRNGA